MSAATFQPSATATTTRTPDSSGIPTLTPSPSPAATATQPPLATATSTEPAELTATAPAATSTPDGLPQTEMPCPATSTPIPTATPVPTNTNTPLLGPEVTLLGIADPTGALINPIGSEGGRTVYRAQFGSGFILFVEGRPGITGLPLGALTTNRSPFDPTVRPDLQMLVDRDLGDGSTASCDNSAPNLGGVPAVDPPDYSVTQEVSDALNDLACRFSTFDESQFPCTQDGSGNFAFIDPNSTRQFCLLISSAIAFQAGDTHVTARLRDSGGNAGPATSIIVRVAL